MKPPKLALFVFIDALGWKIVSRRPFLDDILTWRQPLRTILGYSSTCDPTILTGKMPREHGHFSFFAYDPQASPFALCRLLAVLPKAVTRRGRVRRVMSRVIRRLYGYTGYFQIYNMPFGKLPLFDYTEKRDLYQPGGINGGCPTIFDHLRGKRIPFSLSDWRRSEEFNLRRLEDALVNEAPPFAYLYMAAMDAILHADGTVSPRVDAKIRWYEEKLRHILAVARERYQDVRLYVFSDHGMTDTLEDCDVISAVAKTGLRFGRDYAAVYDSTMARFWFLRPGAREAVSEALGREKRGRILTDEELARYGCDFPGRRYGDLFFLMDPGMLLCPSFMGETHLPGMHGYDPGHEDSVAAFLASGKPDPVPGGLEDLYALMRAEAGEGEP